MTFTLTWLILPAALGVFMTARLFYNTEPHLEGMTLPVAYRDRSLSLSIVKFIFSNGFMGHATSVSAGDCYRLCRS